MRNSPFDTIRTALVHNSAVALMWAREHSSSRMFRLRWCATAGRIAGPAHDSLANTSGWFGSGGRARPHGNGWCPVTTSTHLVS